MERNRDAIDRISDGREIELPCPRIGSAKIGRRLGTEGGELLVRISHRSFDQPSKVMSQL